jgi:hypothetical protein
MYNKEHLSRAGWFHAHKKGARLPGPDPFDTLPPGPSLLARKYIATHLGGRVAEEDLIGLLQEDELSKRALLQAKNVAKSKQNSSLI